MSVFQRVLGWLEDKSDWLSPLVVKEVRQVVRGREFILSFGASLTAGLLIAFFGAAEALTGSSTSGEGTFASLMGCLAFLGLVVVPLGAFSALRNERMEQTLELITLTALSSRRIVIGKLLSQVVKLATLFAAMAPFMTMSFLLGGIDFVTIPTSLVLLFMGSVWVGALCLFLSTTFTSRAMSGLIFAAVGIVVMFVLILGRTLFMASSMGVGPGLFTFTGSSASIGWVLAVTTTFWLTSLVNLVLLAENRLSLSTEDTVTPLRIGFLVEFLAIIAWTVGYANASLATASRAEQTLLIFGSAHLALVAAFAVTDDFIVPRRVLLRMRSRPLLAIFGPGAGRGATYVLMQMGLLYLALAVFPETATDRRWLLAVCGYICFFTGVPVLAFWRIAPARATPLRLRVTVLVTLAASMVLPDIVHYAVMRPEVLDVTYSGRHLLNPLRTISNWSTVEAQGWVAIPFLIGLTGLMAHVELIRMGARATARPVAIDPHHPAPVTGEAGSGDVLY